MRASQLNLRTVRLFALLTSARLNESEYRMIAPEYAYTDQGTEIVVYQRKPGGLIVFRYEDDRAFNMHHLGGKRLESYETLQAFTKALDSILSA